MPQPVVKEERLHTYTAAMIYLSWIDYLEGNCEKPYGTAKDFSRCWAYLKKQHAPSLAICSLIPDGFVMRMAILVAQD